MKLTPENIAGPLADAYGTPWQDAITPGPGEDIDSFAFQLTLLDAVQCEWCEGWFEEGDTACDPDGYSERECCADCWEVIAADAYTRREYEAAQRAICKIEENRK